MNRRLTHLERGTAVGLHTAQWSQYKIARHLNCAPKTVRETLKKIKISKKLEDAPRSGCPRKTTPREDRTLKIISLQNRKLTATKIAQDVVPTFAENELSVRTVRNRLIESDLNGRVARKKPLLSAKNIKARYEWAKIHRQVTLEEWKTVIFSDESPFCLFQDSGKIYVRRRVGEEFLDECLCPTVKHGGGSINIWGCFSWKGAGPLKRIDGIMDGAKYRGILKTYMAPYLKELEKERKEECIFQQDNDPKHTSKVVKNYLNNKGIRVMEWPSQSPDMNPIENAWKYLKDRIVAHMPKPQNLDDVWAIIKEEWSKIPPAYFQNLIEGMPKRCNTLYSVRGRHTKY